MTFKDQLKILDNKVRQNQTDYDLYRKNAFDQQYVNMSNTYLSIENSKTNDSNRFRLYFTDKIDLRGNKK